MANEVTKHTFIELLLYKIDRTLAVVGIIVLGCVSILHPDAAQAAGGAISALGVLLGVKIAISGGGGTAK